MRINNEFKNAPNIIMHKVRKTKKNKRKDIKLKLGFSQQNNIKYLKIDNQNEKIILKIKDNILNIDIISDKKYDTTKLKKLLEKTGWKVNVIEKHKKRA